MVTFREFCNTNVLQIIEIGVWHNTSFENAPIDTRMVYGTQVSVERPFDTLPINTHYVESIEINMPKICYLNNI